jgi:CO/xanthine dehydrogenase Mo-binding subunit
MNRLEERLTIEYDGTVVVRSGKVELGQGIRIAFARLVANELAISVDDVRVELGDTEHVPWDTGTFGSFSVKNDGALLAHAAAFARELLLERAAHRWGMHVEDLAVAGGSVVARDGRRASYASLAAEPLTGDIPEDTPLAPQHPETPAHDERRALISGAARFVCDLRVPGMLRARVLHPPQARAHLISLDDRAARAIEGVVDVVREGDFVGVVAEHAWQARQAVEALVAAWSEPTPLPDIERWLTMRADFGVNTALAAAQVSIDAVYELPHVASAPIGTSAALAEDGPDGMVIRATTQSPFRLREEVGRVLGRAPIEIRAIAGRCAGSFGRFHRNDVAIEAARLARAVRRPVLLEWSRADELTAGPHRPSLRSAVRVGCDADGRLVAWASDVRTNPHFYFGDLAFIPAEMLGITCGRNAVPPYRLPVAEVQVHIVPAQVRTSSMRTLAGAPNVFAIESAIDELAARAGLDPLEMRLRNTDDPRLRRVLERVAERSGWAHRTNRLGLACAVYNGTYVAQVAEVAIDDGRVRVERAWCAIDCGTLVDRDGALNEIEGSIVHATSWALIEQLDQVAGHVLARTWNDNPILTFREVPRSIDVVFTDDGVTPPSGVGEPGAVPFGAAIANAVAAATGVRVRTQPVHL